MDKLLNIKLFQELAQNISILFLYFVKYDFYQKFLGFKNRKYIFFITQIFMTFMNAFIINSVATMAKIMICLIFEFAVIYIICNGKIVIKLYAVIVNETVLLLISLMFLIIDFKLSPIIKLFVNHNNYKMANFVLVNLSDIRIYLITFIFLKCIYNVLKIREKNIDVYKAMILIIPCLSIYSLSLLFYVIQSVKIKSSGYFLFSIFTRMYYILPLICALMLVSILIMAYVFMKMIYIEEENEKLVLARQRLQLQVKHNRHTEGINTKIRGVMHDINNHIICIKNLADNHKNDEIKKYLRNIEDSLNELEFKIKTGNVIADAVINEKFNSEAADKIKFECEVVLPQNINIEPIDLSIILNNTLDNAIEACRKIKDENILKRITVKSYIRGIYLIIEISNSNTARTKYNGNKIITTKADKINHGIGISNVKFVVSKYDGVFDIIEEKYKFTVNIMLRVTHDKVNI